MIAAANLCPTCLARIEDHPGDRCPVELERERRERQAQPSKPTTFWNKFGG